MPRRPSRLALKQPNPLHEPTKSSHLRVPPSPHSPLTPLHAPARLQHRTLLPSPLQRTPFNPAPTIPYPWIWRCHLCHSVYRLGVTRRCLEDGHLFCSFPSPPSSDAEDENPNENTHAEPPAGSTKRKKRRPVRGCRAEFDYAGWSNYNVWRREGRLCGDPSSAADTPPDDLAEDCWRDCDFPSECHNVRAERLRAARAAATSTTRPLNLAQEWAAIKAKIAVQEDIEALLSASEDVDEVYLAPAPAPTEEERIVHAERRGQEDEAKLVDVSVRDVGDGSFLIDDLVDDPAELEFAFVEKKRKKSILKIHQLTGLMLGTEVDPAAGLGEGSPSSPLKESATVDDYLVDVDLSVDLSDAGYLSDASRRGDTEKMQGVLGRSVSGRKRSERLKNVESTP
jgi:hypothetical protein